MVMHKSIGKVLVTTYVMISTLMYTISVAKAQSRSPFFKMGVEGGIGISTHGKGTVLCNEQNFSGKFKVW